jgi:hypothetical protein
MRSTYADDQDSKHRLLEELQEHHKAAENAYKSKAKDKVISKNDPSMKVVAFDLEQTLPTPLIDTSIAFYKRQLRTYNLTVHDTNESQSAQNPRSYPTIIKMYTKMFEFYLHNKAWIQNIKFWQ